MFIINNADIGIYTLVLIIRFHVSKERYSFLITYLIKWRG